MRYVTLALLVVFLFITGCGVRGEPSRRQDEVFIRKSQVIKSLDDQSRRAEKEKIIQKKEKK